MNRDRLEGILTQTIDIPQLHKAAAAEVLAEYDRLTAENARLREALLRYPEWDYTDRLSPGKTQRLCYCCGTTGEHADDCLRQSAIAAAEEKEYE